MKTQTTNPLAPAHREALEARFALRLSARLDQGTQTMPHDITERLRVARETAVRVARDNRVAALTPAIAPASGAITGLQPVMAGGVSTANGLSGWSESRQSRAQNHGRRLDESPTHWGWRFASALPILALVGGLWGIAQYYKSEQIQAATEVDMALLTDDLPPAAYADPGFAEFLRSDTGPTVRSLDAPPPEVDGDLSTTETAPASVTP